MGLMSIFLGIWKRILLTKRIWIFQRRKLRGLEMEVNVAENFTEEKP
jgi:hypothetical protein